MANSSQNITQTVPFSFDEIYNDIKNRFIAKGYDSIYEGSNTAQLITGMSYVASMLNANTSINLNEMLLPLATKRENVIQDARLLGYEPTPKKSYRYKLTLSFDNVGTYDILKYSKFTSGTNTYYYIGETLPTITITQGMIDSLTNTVNIEVIEGDLKLYSDVNYSSILKIVTNYVIDSNNISVPQYYVDIPFSNVEKDGIFMFLDYIDENGNVITSEPWYKSDKFMVDKDTNLIKKFVRIDDIKTNFPRCYFKLSGVGNDVRSGTTVKMNVLVSKGTLGEATGTFKTTISGISITSTLLSNGADEESIFSIKENAPLLYNTGSRAVVGNDYKTISERNTYVQYAQVWGGEDEVPIVLGNIYFSLIPETLYNGANFEQRSLSAFDSSNKLYNLDLPEDLNKYFLTDEQISSTNVDPVTGNITNPGVFDIIKEYNLPALKLNVRHPIYIDISLEVNVIKYSIDVSRNTYRESIFNIINDYMKLSEVFYLEFFKSNIIKRVDKFLTDSTGIELKATFNPMITSKNINNETSIDDGKIIIPLSAPYEPLYNSSGDIDFTVLPVIDTLNFMGTGINLEVDFTSYTFPVGVPNNSIELVEYDILIKDTNTTTNYISGKYKIHNLKTTFITVELFIKSTVNSTYVSYFDSTSFDIPKYLDLSYKTENFRFSKNAIPRLKKVTFV